MKNEGKATPTFTIDSLSIDALVAPGAPGAVVDQFESVACSMTTQREPADDRP